MVTTLTGEPLAVPGLADAIDPVALAPAPGDHDLRLVARNDRGPVPAAAE